MSLNKTTDGDKTTPKCLLTHLGCQAANTNGFLEQRCIIDVEVGEALGLDRRHGAQLDVLDPAPLAQDGVRAAGGVGLEDSAQCSLGTKRGAVLLGALLDDDVSRITNLEDMVLLLALLFALLNLMNDDSGVVSGERFA